MSVRDAEAACDNDDDIANRIIRQRQCCCADSNPELPRPARGSVVEAFIKKSKIQASLGDPGRALQNNRGMACSRTVNFRRAQLVHVGAEFATASATDKGGRGCLRL